MDNAQSSLPESDPVSPVPESVSGEPEPSAVDLSHVPAAHRDVVRRLYRQVEEAIQTIQELRSKNERLRERVEELEAGPEIPEDETLFTLDDDPDVLRGRITQFIDAIDTYLETVPDESPTASEDA